ncbi:glycosyltransferase family 4 protein [Enterococcus hirae]|uniref:glycosyltransferase family 4 protein n=1 Tax=Enterococcus hirae TaxID=1354 RepID=UPI00391D6C01
MNILMIGPSMEAKGGISTVIKNMYDYQGKDQFKVVSNWSENHRLLPFFKNCITLRKKIKHENIDIVHLHVAQKGSFYRKSLLLFLLPKEVKTIFHMHASQFDLFYQEKSKRKKKIIRRCLNKVDLIVAVSENWKNFYQNITDTPVRFINNAVKIPIDNKYQTTANRILTLGRIGKRKGSYDLLKVAEIVGKVHPNIIFELYGDGEVEKFRHLASQLPNVKINGWLEQRDKEKILQNSLMHFLPSYNEGLPMSVLETMSYGIPNLTTTIGGIPKLITDNKEGFLTKPGDIEEMSKKICLYLEKSSAEKALISENSFKKIMNNFSLDNYMNQWHNIYISLTEQKS